LLGYRAYLESPEAGQNHLWYLKGKWLFVFRTKTTDDKEEFVIAYLKAISSHGKETGKKGETVAPQPAPAP